MKTTERAIQAINLVFATRGGTDGLNSRERLELANVAVTALEQEGIISDEADVDIEYGVAYRDGEVVAYEDHEWVCSGRPLIEQENAVGIRYRIVMTQEGQWHEIEPMEHAVVELSTGRRGNGPQDGREVLRGEPRPFELVRSEDVSGVSGTGVIAHGVEWQDGTVAIRWLGERASTVIWNSLDDAMRIHGHEGRTHYRYIGDDDVLPEQAVLEVIGELDTEAANSKDGSARFAYRAAAEMLRKALGVTHDDPKFEHTLEDLL
jgi:hypothetical protein